jgi:hypothetical protein
VCDGIEHNKKSVPEIRKAIHAARDIVSYFNRSPPFRQALQKQRKSLGLTELGLIQVTLYNIKLSN